MPASGCPRHSNAILAALSPDDHRIISDHGETVELQIGAVLYHVGDPMDSVYFPTSGLISLLGTTQEGHSVEVGAIGREGFLGLPLLLGHDRQQHLALMEQSGAACRVPAAALKDTPLESLRRAGMLYAHLRIVELSQSALCNRFHPLQQRLCRWLLTSHYRTGSDKLEFTQEVLSHMLGAGRPVVTIMARRLQQEGAIEYRRGCITILDCGRLQACACECYGVVRTELETYLTRLRAA